MELYLMRLFITILFVLSVNVAFASESIPFMKIPPGVTTAQAVTAISNAAALRRWTAEGLENNQVRIKLNHRGYKAVLDFSFTEHEIYYSDSTTTYQKEDIDSDDGKWVKSPAPQNWVLNLKRDVSKYFSMIKINNSSKKAPASETIESKLEKLKDLYDKKLINESEYEAKKKEIMSSY